MAKLNAVIRTLLGNMVIESRQTGSAFLGLGMKRMRIGLRICCRLESPFDMIHSRHRTIGMTGSRVFHLDLD